MANHFRHGHVFLWRPGRQRIYTLDWSQASRRGIAGKDIDRVPHLIRHVNKFAIRMKRKMAWATAGRDLGGGRVVGSQRPMGGIEFERFKARRLVELTIQYLPNKSDVGGPIDELEMDANGPHWIQVKPHCAQ